MIEKCIMCEKKLTKSQIALGGRFCSDECFDKKEDMNCQYGYHTHLTFFDGDGWYDTWRCDRCDQDAICTGELKNHGAEQMAQVILKFLKDPNHPGSIGSETAQECVKEIKSLHQRINFLSRKVND